VTAEIPCRLAPPSKGADSTSDGLHLKELLMCDDILVGLLLRSAMIQEVWISVSKDNSIG
jgi:hypothetical protein